MERSNWIGKAVLFPRSQLPAVKKRDEFQQTGVYLLLGPEENGDGEMLYIGEGDPVCPRLESHYAKKDFWNRAVFFVSTAGQLNKAHVKYLEHRLVDLAKEAKRMVLDNIQSPSQPTLTEADRADMEAFLDHILGILPVLGIQAIEKPPKARKNDSAKLYISASSKGLKGSGAESAQGFEQNDGMRFAQNYDFNSPSKAACVILGRSANSRKEWTNKDGMTLKEIQESRVAQGGQQTA